ncbi:unnamed protein product [marine sediment metagenome]|uniref:UDP-glucose/GDP-mannose dehydrogenase N-terminal domain-containing protein n=1 Tax=marine sediment metagenome TaxID=412755 RepID=X1S669_9ZZZZ
MNKTHKKNARKEFDIVIIGGLGHVGLPLGISFAHKGLRVCLYDIDSGKADLIKKGEMPFIEYGAEPLLKQALAVAINVISGTITSSPAPTPKEAKAKKSPAVQLVVATTCLDFNNSVNPCSNFVVTSPSFR